MPTGFECGYGGSGPAQLALALFVDAVGPEAALDLYQRFKRARVAKLSPAGGWVIDQAELLEWVAANRRPALGEEFGEPVG